MRSYSKISNLTTLSTLKAYPTPPGQRQNQSTPPLLLYRGGIVFFFAGGAVFYCARIHPSIAQYSTEAQFALMTNHASKNVRFS
jgi:hypothetical protein